MAPSLSPPENRTHHQHKTWQDLAERLIKEQDSQKFSELAAELIDVLDGPTTQRRPEPTPVNT